MKKEFELEEKKRLHEERIQKYLRRIEQIMKQIQREIDIYRTLQ